MRVNRGNLWLGAALSVGASWLFLLSPLGDVAAQLSFDLLFPFRLSVPVDEVQLVYQDDASRERLSQSSVDRWDRRHHARLIERLTAAQARAIVFDVWFDGVSSNDPALLQAIGAAKAAGTDVVLAGAIVAEGVGGEAAVQRVIPPFQSGAGPPDPGESAVADRLEWGVPQAGSPARVARQHFRPQVDAPTLAERVMALTRTNAARGSADRWFNFYGPPGHLPFVSYYRVLEPGSLPAETFSNKVVFVGANTGIDFIGGAGTDHFPSPYLGRGGARYPGVDLNATAYLNLAREDALRRVNPSAQLLLLVGTGIVLTVGLGRGRAGAGRAIAGVALVMAGALGLAWFGHWWFSWIVVVAVQAPVALASGFRIRRREVEVPGGLKAAPPAPRPKPSGRENPRDAAEAATTGVDDAQAWPPPIPDHVLLRRVGGGAYGEIWLARTAVGTLQVVKIIGRDRFESDGPFEREFRGLQNFVPISRSHPGLVDILHVGRNDASGIIYYVMEPADDEVTGTVLKVDAYAPLTLSGWLRARKRIAAEDCLGLAIPLASALGHLHGHQLMHRDIKPTNIIFVGGKPKLADIGLVTEINSRLESSHVGTQGYIPPEGPGLPTADVFALGLVLYQVLTGLASEKFPSLPEGVLQRPDAKLFLAINDVILKACAVDPDERFPNGNELAGALTRLAAGRDEGGRTSAGPG